MATFIRELAGTLLAQTFDPMPVCFRRADESGVRPVRAGCKKPQGTLHAFRQQLNRNAFLCGCHDFTCEAPVEHLIIGFGFRHGSTTVVKQMSHAAGSQTAVSIPEHVASAVRDHIWREHENEVLLFHNHPRSVLNVVFDNTPLPSGADRRALVSFNRDLVTLGKGIMGGGRIRFYVGENGYVQEFRTPDLLTFAEPFLAQAPKHSPATH